MKIKNTIREIRKYRTPSCIKCMHSRFKPSDGTMIYCACPAFRDYTERMKGEIYAIAKSRLVRGTRWCRFEQKPPNERCGRTYRNPFFTCYPREFWKDNKKRAGEVCEKCRNEIDYDQVRRRKAKAGEAS